MNFTEACIGYKMRQVILLILISFIVPLASITPCLARPLERPTGPEESDIPVVRPYKFAGGSYRLLFVLADFPDAPLFNTYASTIFDILNTGNAAGVASYFSQVSDGGINFSTTVRGTTTVDTPNNINNGLPIRMPKVKSYYTAGNGGLNLSRSDYPANIPGLVRDVAAQLDGISFDFAPFADPGTNEITYFIVVPQGGEESGNSGEIVPSSGNLALYESGGYRTRRGYLIRNFAVCPTDTILSPQKMGKCLTQVAHLIGMLPRDSSDPAVGSTGVYSLMGSSRRVLSSGAPFPEFSAYERVSARWVSAQEAPPGDSQFILQPRNSATTRGNVIKIRPTKGPDEDYFMLEPYGIPAYGSSAGSTCTGALLWHIDERSVSPLRANGKRVQTNPELKLITADGTLLQNDGEPSCGHLFQAGSEIDDNTKQSVKLWDGSNSSIKLKFSNSNNSRDLAVAVSRAPAVAATPTPTTTVTPPPQGTATATPTPSTTPPSGNGSGGGSAVDRSDPGPVPTLSSTFTAQTRLLSGSVSFAASAEALSCQISLAVQTKIGSGTVSEIVIGTNTSTRSSVTFSGLAKGAKLRKMTKTKLGSAYVRAIARCPNRLVGTSTEVVRIPKAYELNRTKTFAAFVRRLSGELQK